MGTSSGPRKGCEARTGYLVGFLWQIKGILNRVKRDNKTAKEGSGVLLPFKQAG